MNDTPASGERVQKYVFNFEIYRFAKKAAKLPHPPLHVSEYSETRTDTVRSVRSGCYAHDFHSTEVRAQTI